MPAWECLGLGIQIGPRDLIQVKEAGVRSANDPLALG
jgi:hypothetical protein